MKGNEEDFKNTTEEDFEEVLTILSEDLKDEVEEAHIDVVRKYFLKEELDKLIEYFKGFNFSLKKIDLTEKEGDYYVRLVFGFDLTGNEDGGGDKSEDL